MQFPEHKASLRLTHNEHLDYYQTVENWIEENGTRHFATWVSDDQKQKAIETNEFWVLQWYPDTPVGFYCLAAADLDVLLAASCDPETLR